MGLAALNPFSRLRVLLARAAADAALDAVGQLAPTLRGLDGPVIDAVRESEARIMAEISDLRARLNFVEDAPAFPTEGRGRLSGDPMGTHPCRNGPHLESLGAVSGRHPPLAGKRRHP